jgi:signal transduction histidine kinase
VELIGRHFTTLLQPEVQAAARLSHRALLETGQQVPAEWRVVRRDGTLGDVQVTAACFLSDDGRRFRVTTATDATALRRLEEQFGASDKMEAISRLAGGLAHGFNNLLTIITGYSQLLRSALPPADPLAVYADEIFRAADRAATLTGKLLAFSRHRIGHPERLDLNGMVGRLLSGPGHLRLPSGVRLAVELAGELAPVVADRAYIEEAIRDLAINATEAMPRGGRLAIRTRNVEAFDALPPGRYVLLEIEDTGEGMDPETQRHLFEPFYTTKGVGKGTGLATVYGTVKQFGGEVLIATAPGRGTTVSVYLPAAQ